MKILLNGVTGRMGRRRHLEGALLPLRSMGEPLDIAIVGRESAALTQIAEAYGLRTLDTLAGALASEPWDLFFDAGRPIGRRERLAAAIGAGCAVYSEKPVCLAMEDVRHLQLVADERSVQTFVVTDKLFTPGYRALREVLRRQLLGKVCDVRGEFGYFVETGFGSIPPQRPSWNYSKASGGSHFPDLFSHWTYMLEMIGDIGRVHAVAATHIPLRMDESGTEFEVDVADTAHVIGEFTSGATFSVSTSWLYRPAIPFTMRVHGLAASVTVTPSECVVHVREGESFDAVEEFGVSAEDEFLLQWRGVLRELESGNRQMPDFRSALRQARVCEALESSALTSAMLDVAPERCGGERTCTTDSRLRA